MRLDELPLQDEYRTGRDDPLRDFFLPLFKVATRYDRAVGYFSSSALECFAKPLDNFVQFGGTIRLVTSVELQQGDLDAINAGMAHETVCQKRVEEIINREFGHAAVSDGVRKLAALLQTGRMQLRIAAPVSGSGIYHEKVGIFHGASEEFIAFSGSTNESREALTNNYECIDVFTSWAAIARAGSKREHFEALWSGTAPGARTYEFWDAARNNLIRAIAASPHKAAVHPAGEPANALWPHQQRAIDEFLLRRRGILEMATGTGKTRTALAIIKHLIDTGAISSAIVACDGNDLMSQWAVELAGTLGAVRFRLLRHFDAHAERDEFVASPDRSVLLCWRQALSYVLANCPAGWSTRTLIVHDEVHRFGSPGHVAKLDSATDGVPYRLGLSATPEREYDADGTAFIERNIGPVIFRYPLEEAIADGILCELDYVPLKWRASAADRKEVNRLHRVRAARAENGNPMTDEEFRREVARVYKISVTKLPAFYRYLRKQPQILERAIVFVAERDYAEHVFESIHEITSRFNTYFADDHPSVLRDFSSGDLECLVACHRLSEGIDIRSIRNVILLSSDRSRLETIQRIGRCLRVLPSEPSKRATVVDLVRLRSKRTEPPTADEERMSWLQELAKTRRRPC